PQPAPITKQEIGQYREQDYARVLTTSSCIRVGENCDVSRIMMDSVPPTVRVVKDVREFVQEYMDKSISPITSEAA
ncbi:hypothetical protein K488DRAFT_35652, partial [Vararia minispora EC-137]